MRTSLLAGPSTFDVKEGVAGIKAGLEVGCAKRARVRKAL
jgi:hypothetical protein